MENSSKALLIAGGVLIAVLILSLFVYLYITMHNFSNEYNSNIDSQKLQAFNAQFEVYNGREDLTAQDIVTIVNLANESNIEVRGITINNKFDFMKNNENIYTCDEIRYDNDTGKVNIIFLSQN